jgi:hypothetical protein
MSAGGMEARALRAAVGSREQAVTAASELQAGPAASRRPLGQVVAALVVATVAVAVPVVAAGAPVAAAPVVAGAPAVVACRR